MKKITTIFILLILIWANSITMSFASTEADPYIYQYLSPKNITGADDLKTKLEDEVKKIIAAGHLAPFRAIYGEFQPHYHWYHTFDTVYTLSLAYPYMSSTVQGNIKTYLTTEMQTYPLWSATYLNPTNGTKRYPDQLTNTEIGQLPQDYNTRPKLFSLYALWLYANSTGDWNYIQNNWTSIKSFYTSYRSETANFYTSNAGAIGYARMAHQKNPPDSAAENQALTDINIGITNGKNFNQFGTNAENAFKYIGEPWDYVKSGSYMGWQFLDITPEIGRYIRDNTNLKSAVLGTSPTDIYSLSRAEYYFPFWYVSQGPFNTIYYGEGSGISPDTRGMVFPLKNWVQQRPASELRKYLDVPDALIGDYYYMQNIARTIEASGIECWIDITNPAQQCTSTITPTIQPGTPTPTPKPGDVNNDGTINLADLSTLLANFGKSGMSRTQGDLTGDNIVNLSDLSQLLSKFGS